MSTIGLAIITNELEETEKLIETYSPYFDKFFITVADKNRKVYDQLKASHHDKVELSFFKWVDHFGKARLFNQKQVTTDYWMWMDTDDEITNPEKLKEIIDQMSTNGIDVMFMNYDYYENAYGEQQANHWRERIIRTASGCKWENVPCHETVPAKGRAGKTELCSVKHHKPLDQMLHSMDRNQAMLEKDWKTNKDPRTAYYLGMTYQYHQKLDEAIKMYKFLIEKGGWDEQKSVAWRQISECYFNQQKYPESLEATEEMLRLDPASPDGYFQKVMIYMALKDYAKAREWAYVALQKKVDPNSMQLIDPTREGYIGQFLAAQAYLFGGEIEKAFELYKEIVQTAPHHIEQMSQANGINWNQTFVETFNSHKAIEAIKYLTSYLKDRGGDLDKLFRSLPAGLALDQRLQFEYALAQPPKKWPEKSIAIYCGQGFEAWGPDTLKDGLGGSEEAVVYLSRELVKLGWTVTVFCERDNAIDDDNAKVIDEVTAYNHYATYRPWSEFNPHDDFDVFIAWRQPVFLQGIKARKKIVDLHDTMPEETLLSVLDQVDMFMVKSRFHRSLYPNIPDDKIDVVTNGIYKGLAYEV